MRRWLVVGLVAAVVLVAGAVAFWAFVLNDDAPERLALTPTTAAPASTAPAVPDAPDVATTQEQVGLAGEWIVGEGSVAGYRVREQLASLPAPNDAVGRTEAVEGRVVLEGDDDALTLASADLRVDLTTLASDSGRRDNAIRTRGLETDLFPEATFVLGPPVPLPAGAADGDAVQVQATGDLTLHGTTRTVTIPLDARRDGEILQVVGALTFPFSDFGMEPPSIGGFVSVQDDATLEFQVFLNRATAP